MPEISRFYGMVISMYFKDHAPPHIHVDYGDRTAVFDIRTLQWIEGDFPNKATKLVKQWMRLYQNELLDIWESQNFRKLPPLE